METQDLIHLQDYIVSADIGAFHEERGQEQRLRFNLTVALRDPLMGVHDHVDRILSYDVLTDAISAALDDQRYNLLETLAEKIAADVLAHPRAAHIEVKVEKLDRLPGALGVTINRTAGRVAADTESRKPLVHLAQIGKPLPDLPNDGPVVLVAGSHASTLPQATDPEAARRIALLALDQSAWVLASQTGLIIADSKTELAWALQAGRHVIWAPARMIADMPDQEPNATAIAYWIAQRLDAYALYIGEDETGAPPPPDFDIPVTRN